MLLRDLHKIGPGDTPFPAFSSSLFPGLAGWLDGSGGVLHASSQALRHWGTSVPRYLPRYCVAQTLKSDSADHLSNWPLTVDPLGLGTTLPDPVVDGNLA